MQVQNSPKLRKRSKGMSCRLGFGSTIELRLPRPNHLSLSDIVNSLQIVLQAQNRSYDMDLDVGIGDIRLYLDVEQGGSINDLRLSEWEDEQGSWLYLELDVYELINIDSMKLIGDAIRQAYGADYAKFTTLAGITELHLIFEIEGVSNDQVSFAINNTMPLKVCSRKLARETNLDENGNADDLQLTKAKSSLCLHYRCQRYLGEPLKCLTRTLLKLRVVNTILNNQPTTKAVRPQWWMPERHLGAIAAGLKSTGLLAKSK